MANIDAMKILGSILNSGALSRGSGSDVLGSVVGALTGSGASGGGLGDLLGGMLGGGDSSRSGEQRGMPGGAPSGGGGLDDLLGGLLGGGSGGSAGLTSLLGAALSQIGGSGGAASSFDPGQLFSQESDDGQVAGQATLMIRAMINAAKADGQVDREEQQKILGKLGDVTRDEYDFVRGELSASLDMEAFVRSIPRDMAQQVYAMSLMAIDLDSQSEARYLHQLAQGTGISAEESNAIHERLGAPAIYR